MLNGVNASKGIGIGKVMLIKEPDLSYESRKIEDTAGEVDRFKKAVEVFIEKTQEQADNIKNSIGEKEAEIIMGHIIMMQDPYMNGEIIKQIEGGTCAEDALVNICDMFIGVFSMAEDELTKQRASDVADIKGAILGILLNVKDADIASAPKGTVLVASDLTPSMTALINKENISAIVTEVGGKTSHSAILARAMEIPAVLSVSNAMTILKNDETVIVDGSQGEIIQNPSNDKIRDYEEKQQVFLKNKEELKKFIGKKTVTADNIQVELCCNIGKPDDANGVIENDGEGVGLFRTEFLYMDSTTMPSEDEQFEAYKKAGLILKDKPLIIRTLDVGGDKDIPYLGLTKEENPFLGFRAIRYCLNRDDVYMPQLRALLRASAFCNIKIMVPLVTCVDELTAVKTKVKDIMAEFDKDGIDYNKDIQIGVMIETPAASIMADILSKEADFFSIGTNDLTGYTMCVDRGNADVSYLYSTYNPAVLRSIRNIIQCGNAENIMVGMCGEAAADPLLIPLLISFGLGEYSVSSTSVLETRKTISLWSKADADAVAEKAMAMTTEKEVREYLESVAK